MNRLIKLLNIPLQINMDGNSVYEFEDYDEFTNIYNTLEKTNIINKNSPQSFLNEEACHVEFDGDDFYVYLDGDFNIDKYKITIVEETDN